MLVHGQTINILRLKHSWTNKTNRKMLTADLVVILFMV